MYQRVFSYWLSKQVSKTVYYVLMSLVRGKCQENRSLSVVMKPELTFVSRLYVKHVNCMFFYIAVFSPLDRSKSFTITPGTSVHYDINSIFLGNMSTTV